MIFDSNRTSLGSSIPMAEGYNCSYGPALALIESANNDLAVFKAILDSDEYRRYVKLNEELKKRPDLKRAVDEFRKQNFYYQYSDDVDDAIGKSEELAKNFAATRSIKLVNDFLVTEMCLDRMIQQICISLVSVMDFDVDFLDD
jgi:cell fate (sporulation/competence/biofilm development) regulator YlbF (YheA/YmcA/DUF963 family)